MSLSPEGMGIDVFAPRGAPVGVYNLSNFRGIPEDFEDLENDFHQRERFPSDNRKKPYVHASGFSDGVGPVLYGNQTEDSYTITSTEFRTVTIDDETCPFTTATTYYQPYDKDDGIFQETGFSNFLTTSATRCGSAACCTFTPLTQFVVTWSEVTKQPVAVGPEVVVIDTVRGVTTTTTEVVTKGILYQQLFPLHTTSAVPIRPPTTSPLLTPPTPHTHTHTPTSQTALQSCQIIMALVQGWNPINSGAVFGGNSGGDDGNDPRQRPTGGNFSSPKSGKSEREKLIDGLLTLQRAINKHSTKKLKREHVNLEVATKLLEVAVHDKSLFNEIVA
ncbi:hypothetical protein CLAFUR4_01817 [Fulvia fulva]|nr:hypothetical protein CLAFUR4_01817 [Fulvia fulva]KAK4637010.1 hypothetical protein CLAFUR0_01819 [Fulvia fulva]WPV25356.1 hypothetical protein CLAFUW7_01821 [Fulvia fulva]